VEVEGVWVGEGGSAPTGQPLAEDKYVGIHFLSVVYKRSSDAAQPGLFM